MPPLPTPPLALTIRFSRDTHLSFELTVRLRLGRFLVHAELRMPPAVAGDSLER